MTNKQANIDKNFEIAPSEHKLRTIDRMMRTNPHARCSADWFPVSKNDAGRSVKYFYGSGFRVERRKASAPKVKP